MPPANTRQPHPESFPDALRRLWTIFIGEDRTGLHSPPQPDRTLRFGA